MTLELLASAALRMLVVAALLWLTLRLFRVRNPYAESLVWRLVLVAGLALPLLLWSGLTPRVATTIDLPVVLSGSHAADTFVTPEAGVAAKWPGRTLLTIYLSVTLLLLGRLAVGLAATGRLCARARPAPTGGGVRITPHLRSPATFGSVILLPEGSDAWPADTRAAVLAHERAHVRSRDGYWSWLAKLNAAIFWFSPLSWWLGRRLETLAEITSDDAVIAARHDPIAYAALLLEFARQPNYRSVAMSVAESDVPGRIERILSRTPPGAELPIVVRWIAMAVLVPAVFFAASTARVRAESTPATPAATAGAAVRLVKAADPDQFYPAAAKQAKATGLVTLSVSVDRHGQVVDVKVLEPQPADDPFGFGPAAAELARRSQYSNPFPETSIIKFKVKFSLAPEPAPASPPIGATASARMRSAADPDQLYPAGAKRRREQGSPVVLACVGPNGGLLRDPVVIETSNYPELDQAAIDVAKNSSYAPATENGRALAESCIKFKVKFVLASDPPAPSTT